MANRPWHEAVVYELHVGTFSPEGTFAGVQARLDHLVELGITVIELMPIADFPGKRGWGYDGVLLYAPESAYGTPDELKSLVNAAHERGIAVMLDVVYNHFGPEGNYLGMYAPAVLHRAAPHALGSRHQLRWRTAAPYATSSSTTRCTGSRNIIRRTALRCGSRHHRRQSQAHHDGDCRNRAHLCRRAIATSIWCWRTARTRPASSAHPGRSNKYDAQWDDDVHHCLHTILTGEKDGYYSDYAEQPHAKLCRSLAEGFVYQGEYSNIREAPRGEPSAHLPPTAFVIFLQNHDQIGNRALGERLGHIVKNEEALRAATAVLLLAPSPPMLFMGEEWNAPEPFPYFCDFGQELATKVREGRKKEFQHFERFRDPSNSDSIPDPDRSPPP